MIKVVWKDIFLSELFSIKATTYGIDKNKLVNSIPKTFPYITRSETNNGIDMLVGKQEHLVNKGNCITIGLDTQTVFYQSSDFYTGQNIQILRNNMLNKSNANFLIPLLSKVLESFNWGGNGATLGRLKRSRILIPTINSQPAWEYMEDFQKNIEGSKLLDYLEYIGEQLSDIIGGGSLYERYKAVLSKLEGILHK